MQLSREAAELLKEARLDPIGIHQFGHGPGEHIVTNNKEYLTESDARSRAVWKDAVRELDQKGLIEASNGGNFYRLTASGFSIADTL